MKCGASPMGYRKFCHRCGTPLNPEQIVCVRCGASVAPAQAAPNAFNQQNYRGQNYGNQIGETADVPDYMVWAILQTIFCCSPLALIAIFFAAGANSAEKNGNFTLAQKNARTAMVLLIVGLILAIITPIIAAFNGMIGVILSEL